MHLGNRDLKNAVHYLLGREISKEVRTKMSGKRPKDLSTDEVAALHAYCLSDGRLPFELWEKYHDQWPEHEQIVSDLSLRARWRGIPADTEMATKKTEEFKTRKWELGNELPWIEDGEKPMSPAAAREQGRKDNIPMPACFDARDPDFLKWELDYGPQFPWVRARREYSRVNTFMKKVDNFRKNIRPDGTLYYEMKYMGAGVTGRFSGGSDSGEKFNVHNMTRDEILQRTDDEGETVEGSGIALRAMIRAPKGFVIGVQDYSQIEARLLLWRAGDYQTLKMLTDTGMNIYEVYARLRLGWTGGELKKENEELYRLSKALVLGAGYYCGAKKFRVAAWVLARLAITEERSKEVIGQYRASNPKVVAYWKEHQRWLLMSAEEKDATHEVVLASGRRLVYYNPRVIGKDDYERPVVRANFGLGGRFKKIHGGLLTENEMQATSRDILVDAWPKLEAAGHHVLFTLHDEYVYLWPENEAADRAKDAARIATTSSPWAAGCPLAVSSEWDETYG
jgi:hypothetical protein